MEVKIKGKKIEVEVADGMWGKMKGLSGRKDGKMLFHFRRSCKPAFWMFWMKFGLDIVFLDGGGAVVDIAKGAEPMSLNPRTWKVYYPKSPIRYVLELQNSGLEIGEKVEFNKTGS